jgi:uncharacterized protein YndB with AHSA1/START domain
MNAIRHRVGIKAPISEVYEAIATPAGEARWWTRDVEGDGRLGSETTFRFGSDERVAVMEMVELTSPSRVAWRCAKGPDEWVDAPITFDLRVEDGETVVLFEHGGWRTPVEFMNHCSTAWAYYLLSLKHALEGGTATPFPENEKISSWG